MDFEEHNPQIRTESLDADAVCAVCGTVNPEDTLLCKTCGNNLREQRANRAAVEMALESGKRHAWLSKALVAMGILLVVAVFLNIGSIESIMMASYDTTNPAVYWRGGDARTYKELISELKAVELTPELLESVGPDEGAAMELTDGIYVLFGLTEETLGTPVGQVALQWEGDRALIAGLLPYNMELRGYLTQEKDGQYGARQSASVLYNGEYYAASGVGLLRADGGLECYVQSDVVDKAFAAIAYPIPGM